MNQAPTFQIVGYKNSGKTTVLCDLVAYGSTIGDQVATVKHHAHKQPLEPMHTETDSYRLQKAGSFLTGVDNADTFQLEYNHKQSPPLGWLIDLYQSFGPDLILIEGFKKEAYRKAVILKEESDLRLLNLEQIAFVLTWDLEWVKHLEVPVFAMDEWKQSIENIYSIMKGREDDE
ncbi:molybdopterin-guanine dinucleotide biosynthesis protein B [Halobacillus shinanisalinarum]|uniref:Molybdopterin-guanine dinucleotide biosynthesis protein B n=1 Tax=Halobacillus shinanisalinarum TaxID=2932258 RepID=A0ABY4GXF4_9BACI|nr:molybdopterin-guanine dinucleotide biosynthesis protein B [Halobacillus shinanisalinarum]UOQ92818.1 molybdopterin-guanine dinucleotide biosynthesis protein B [Halobacillus shinanisalinarum]